MSVETHAREHWGTRIGLILAMAGNAIGLGNFLRFPVEAAQNGGGAFMIPYVISFLLLGIPLMWLEWGIGRYGGRFGHGSEPGMFDKMWANRAAKYVGVLGLLLPFVILVFYTYVESWSLGYAVFALFGQFGDLVGGVAATPEELRGRFLGFLTEYQGVANGSFSPSTAFYFALAFFLFTLGLNIWILSRGVSGGIEKLAKIGLPILLIFAAILAGYVMFLGAGPGGTSLEGLNFVWAPDWRALWDAQYTVATYGRTPAQIWLAAAGQVFFTLSLGVGSIATYSSYLSAEDDITLTGLATAATNEGAEVILGGTIAIPAAVVFFGITQTQEIAASGSFDLAFAALPAIFAQLPASQLWGVLWFGLLFLAGITSSVALASPIMAFFQDELGWTRGRTAALMAGLVLVFALPNIFWLGEGWLDEWNFWAGTFGLVVLATLEVLLFGWVYGTSQRTGFWNRFFAPPDTMWDELHEGADLRIPGIFKFIIKWVTTPILLVILGVWLVNDAIPTLTFEGVTLPEDGGDRILAIRWGARLTLVAIFAGFAYLVHRAWRSKATEPGGRKLVSEEV